jgi:hypothetical protein
MKNVADRLLEIFDPYADRRIKEAASDNNIDFVHYTSADAAMKIIQSQSWWLRSSSIMNDFQEVSYGIARMDEAEKEHGDCFRDALEAICPGLYDQTQKEFAAWKLGFFNDTFLASFSAHHRDEEDLTGRLSMWRAYGGEASVAIILNKEIFLGAGEKLKIYGSPVAYFDKKATLEAYREVVRNVVNHAEFLRQQSREQLQTSLYNFYRFAILSNKHPGFKEEQEWRIVHSPQFDRDAPLEYVTRPIGGLPQPIVVVPFCGNTASITGIRFSDLFDRLIIGPTQYPYTLYRAFFDLLSRVGVQNPDKRIVVSDIPIRT